MPAKKILLIDDEPAFLDMLSVRLRSGGYEVITATDGLEALARISAGIPDLIVLDVLMPKMNGIQFMQKLRENKALPHIPVIVISARGSMADYFTDALIEQFMSKPFDGAALLSQVDKHIGKMGQRAPGNRLLLAGITYSLTSKIEDLFRRSKWQVSKALEEDTAYKMVHETQPSVILCQYWEPQWEGGVLDTYRFTKLIAENPSVAKIPMHIYCLESHYPNAAKFLQGYSLVKFTDDSDLLPSLAKLCNVSAS